MHIIKGRCWLFGDNIDTDQILPGYAMVEAEKCLGDFAMAGSAIPDFAKHVQKGDIIVAGQNFGCGSSREQAPVALQLAGVSAVIAVSIARIFRRNAINIGLPVIQANIYREVAEGESITLNTVTSAIQIGSRAYQGEQLSESALSTLRAGGLINRVRQELGVTV